MRARPDPWGDDGLRVELCLDALASTTTLHAVLGQVRPGELRARLRDRALADADYARS